MLIARRCSSWLTLCVLLCGAVASAAEQPRAREAAPPSPDATHACDAAASPGWSALEREVWRRVCSDGDGDAIDIAAIVADPGPVCSARRMLTSAFLKSLLTDRGMQEHLTNHGVRLRGATVMGALEASSAEIRMEVRLESFCFTEPLSFRSAILRKDLSLAGSVFRRGLDLRYVRADAGIRLNDVKVGPGDAWAVRSSAEAAAEGTPYVPVPDEDEARNKLDLGSANVAGNIVLRKSRIPYLDLNSVKAGGFILLRDSMIHSANLVGAQIEHLGLQRSRLGSLNLNQVRISGSIRADGASILAPRGRQPESGAMALNIRTARVDGHVRFDDAILMGALDMEGLSVGGTFRMASTIILCTSSEEDCLVDLGNITVGSSLDLNGIRVAGIDASACTISLNGAQVGDTLDLSGANLHCRLGAEDVEVRQLRLRPKDWTGWSYRVSGLRYERLAECEDGCVGPTGSDVEPVLAWLRGQSNPVQPYHHIASVYERAGSADQATSLRFASRWRLFLRACGCEGQPLSHWRCFWDGAQLVFIGFGFYTAAVIPWIVGFVVVGTWVSARASRRGMLVYKGSSRLAAWRAMDGFDFKPFLYSLDCLLPIVEIDPRHRSIGMRSRPAGYLSYFVVHRVMGYVLALFLVASITGLTK